MTKLHPKVRAAAEILQSWVDAKMTPDVLALRLGASKGVILNLLGEAAGRPKAPAGKPREAVREPRQKKSIDVRLGE